MSQTINTNVASLNAQRNLTTSQGSLNQAIQRLSSGLRINSAKDDAAGLAISERFTAQIRGLDQARRNSNDGISLAQVAEGALSQSAEILQRVRELAIQSANATNSAGDRKALNSEVNQLITELSRIASDTTFNGLKILDGSYQAQQFQVGAEANQTIGVSVKGARATDLTNNTVTLTSGGSNTGLGEAQAANNTTPANNGVASQTLTIAGSSGSGNVSIAANDSADVIAAAVNNAAGSTGVNARAVNNSNIESLSAAGTVSFAINGGGTSTTISAQVASTGDLTTLATAINDVSAKTGVTATLTATKAGITLTQKDGKDILITGWTNSGGGNMVVSGNGGDDATLTAAATATRIAGTVTLSSENGFTAVSSAGTTVLTSGTTATASTSANLTTVDISSVTGANSAIDIIDAALAQVSRIRADLGAVQNRFLNTIANLQTTSENVSAARSRIRDADFAAETAALTRAQILQQAGVAMLSQANALPNNVLTLLR